MYIDPINYKGKHHIWQDSELPEDDMDFVLGRMRVEDVSEEECREHYAACRYYGIPHYIGSDKRLLEMFSIIEKEYEEEENA